MLALLLAVLRALEKMSPSASQEAIVTSEELGLDLEHVEVLQKKFEEFQTDLAAHEERVNEVNQFAGKLIQVRAVAAGKVLVLAVRLHVASRSAIRLISPPPLPPHWAGRKTRASKRTFQTGGITGAWEDNRCPFIPADRHS